jgi:hypothetical protein
MIVSRVFVGFLFVFLACLPAFGQQVSCSCDPAPGRTCNAVVKCPDGCTSLCGPGDACYVSCRSNTFQSRITARFTQKTGQEIAAELALQSHQRIQFTPDTRQAKAKYDLVLKNDDLFNALKYLYRRGKVSFMGKDFSNIIEMRKLLKDGKKISINFDGISAGDAVARLAFFSGEPVRIQQGNPDQRISVSIHDATLDEIISRISEAGGVKIRR